MRKLVFRYQWLTVVTILLYVNEDLHHLFKNIRNLWSETNNLTPNVCELDNVYIWPQLDLCLITSIILIVTMSNYIFLWSVNKELQFDVLVVSVQLFWKFPPPKTLPPYFSKRSTATFWHHPDMESACRSYQETIIKHPAYHIMRLHCPTTGPLALGNKLVI